MNMVEEGEPRATSETNAQAPSPDQRGPGEPGLEEARRVEEAWCETVGSKEERKVRARACRRNAVWFGLGAFGLVGWSVAVPTVLGILLGVYIDSRWPSRFSGPMRCT